MSAVLTVAWLPGPVRATETIPPAFSPYREAQGIIYVSGHLPLLPGTRSLDGDDVATQAHRVMRNLSATLADAGVGLADVVRVTVYLTDMADYGALNAAYASHFPQPWPARAVVAVRGLAFGARVEMSCLAVRPRAAAP